MRIVHIDGVYEPLSRATSTFFRHEPITLPSVVPDCPTSKRVDMVRVLNQINDARRATYMRTQGILVDFGPIKELIIQHGNELLDEVPKPNPVDDADTTCEADDLLYHYINAQRFLRR